MLTTSDSKACMDTYRTAHSDNSAALRITQQRMLVQPLRLLGLRFLICATLRLMLLLRDSTDSVQAAPLLLLVTDPMLHHVTSRSTKTTTEHPNHSNHGTAAR